MGIPEEILTDNGGQFVTPRWADFAERIGFAIRKTSPYNPQSNPVEIVMRELGRIIRTYASERQYRWQEIIDRTEKVINATVHSSTGYTPIKLQEEEEINLLNLDERLLPGDRDALTLRQRIQLARQNLEKAAKKRKVQADKKQKATEYKTGDLVWVKLHRRSDANRRLTKKIHLVYDGSYLIAQVIRPNAYLVVDGYDQPLGVYNSRQLRPHRSATENETETEFENERDSPIINMILTYDTDLDPLPEDGEEQTEEEESTTTDEEQENCPLNVTYTCERSRWPQDDVEEKTSHRRQTNERFIVRRRRRTGLSRII